MPAAALWVQHGGWKALLTEGTSGVTWNAQTARKWVAPGALAVVAALWVAPGTAAIKVLLAVPLLVGLILTGACALTETTRTNNPSNWLLCGILFVVGAATLAFVPFNAGLALAIALWVTIPAGILLPYWSRCAAVSAGLLWCTLAANVWP